MKKLRIVAMLTAVLMMTLPLCSCSKDKSSVEAASGEYVMATGGATGTYYSLGETMAALWGAHLPGVTVRVESTGASKENLRLIAGGEADLAIVQGDILWYALNGKELFKGEKLSGISVLASLYPEMVQIVVPASGDVRSVADLAGKRVSVGASGSGCEAAARQILAAYGLDYDLITVKYQSFSDCAAGLKNGTLDAAFVTAGAPNASVLQLSEQTAIRLVPITGPEAQQLKDDFSFFGSCSVPKEAYGLTQDCSTLGVYALLVCGSGLSAGEARDFTAALFDNLAEFGAANAKGGEVSAALAMNGVFTSLHPGAEAYFTGGAEDAQ